MTIHVSVLILAVVAVIIVAYQVWRRTTIAGRIVGLIRDADLSTHGEPLSGSAKRAHDWLVAVGPRALPKLRAANRRLIDKHTAYSEYLGTGPSANPLDNYGRRSRSEKAYRYIIEFQQSRVIDVIEAIDKRS